MTETPQQAYVRGMEYGVVTTRLDTHDETLVALNVTLTKVVDVEATLTLAVASLTQARINDAETRVATAQALKDAKDATDATTRAEADKADRSWAPVTKMYATGTFLFGLIAAYYLLKPGS